MSQFDDMVLNMTQTTPEPEDYTGEDGLLYCGKCRKPKEAYFPEVLCEAVQKSQCFLPAVEVQCNDNVFTHDVLLL